MSKVKVEIDIAAPPERVWELIMDPDRLEEWVTIHRRLGAVSDRPLRQGATMQQSLVLRGARFTVDWTLTEVSKPDRVRWEGKGPARSKADTSYELKPIDSGTRFIYCNEFRAPFGPVGAAASRALVGGVSEREANASLSKLKQLLEREQA
jgi:uncharacterized protein YndB with AHSA1/START domain